MITSTFEPNEDFEYLIAEIKREKDIIDQAQRKIDDLRVEYGEKVLAHGNYESPNGKIELVKASQRVTFDNRVVEAVMNALHEVSPLLAAQLEGAKKVTFVGATWRIK